MVSVEELLTAVRELSAVKEKLDLLGANQTLLGRELSRELERVRASAQRRVNRLVDETTIVCAGCGREIAASLFGDAQWRFSSDDRGELLAVCPDCMRPKLVPQ